MEERRKRRNKGQMSDMEIREYVENLLARLDGAQELDKVAHKAKKPAIAKLKVLPSFEEAVSRPHLHRSLIDAGILGVFNHWLYPHEDGTLPNIKLRTTLLKLLGRMNLDTSLEHHRDQLKVSMLGKVVMFYAKLPDETPSNRRLAAQLVERWSKPVYEQHTRHAADAEHHEESARMRERKRALAAAEEEKAAVGYNAEAKPGDRGFRCGGVPGFRYEHGVVMQMRVHNRTGGTRGFRRRHGLTTSAAPSLTRHLRHRRRCPRALVPRSQPSWRRNSKFSRARKTRGGLPT